jgi:hypothetical protein
MQAIRVLRIERQRLPGAVFGRSISLGQKVAERGVVQIGRSAFCSARLMVFETGSKPPPCMRPLELRSTSVVVAKRRINCMINPTPNEALSWPVGWAKTPDANASGVVPTIQPRTGIKMVGTAQERLCPPYVVART